MIYFTSDQHYGHKNIIEYTSRPYSSIEEMNEKLIDNFNSTVSPNDFTYHLGDFCLSKKHLPIIKQLNGSHHLITGNHDSCYPWKGFKDKYLIPYLDAGFVSVQREMELEIDDIGLCLLNHMPYSGDSHASDRYKEFRPIKQDKHKYLLCGHVHTKWKFSENMINVGVDVWDYKPISIVDLKCAIFVSNTPSG